MKLQVIICTHNPVYDIFHKCINSLCSQTLDSKKWDLLIIDNKSTPAISKDFFNYFPKEMSIIREEQLGLVHARIKGIQISTGDVIVFVDDDNFLDHDYLENVYRLFSEDKLLGAVCGRVEPFYEKTPPDWLSTVDHHLAILSLGDMKKVFQYPTIGDWEPVGAGLAVKKEASLPFLRHLKSSAIPDGLGRKGNSLHGCEDSLLTLLIYKDRYKIAYQPELHLIHYINKERVSFTYHLKLAYSLGKSHAIMRSIIECKSKPQSRITLYIFLIVHFLRLKEVYFKSKLIKWVWMLGYTRQSGKIWTKLEI